MLNELTQRLINHFPLLGREQWKEQKKHSIGGTESSALWGVNPYMTASKLFHNKKEESSQEETLSMARGSYLEPLVIREYERHNQDSMVYIPGDYQLIGKFFDKLERLFVHPEYDFITMTPDGLVVAGDSLQILEIKTAVGFGTAKWDLGIPALYMIQIQKYMGIVKDLFKSLFDFNVKIGCDLAVMLDDKYDCFSVDFNEDLYNNIIVKDIDFYNNHLMKNIPPNPSNEEDARHLYYQHTAGKTIQATSDVVALLMKRQEVTNRIAKDDNAPTKKLRDELSQLNFCFIDFAKDAETIMLGDEILATFKTDKRGSRRIIPNKKLIAMTEVIEEEDW
jgi:predicted phage-related endonuclease